MSNKLKFKIGEFSKMMRVTVKTLRHYEQMGLLIPSEVDEWTGYRYYQIEQMQTFERIRDLKSMGFSLEEIRDLFDSESHTPSVEQLEKKMFECEAELNNLLARKVQLLQMVNYQKSIQIMEKFSVKSLPSIIVASHREVIKSYDNLGDMCVSVVGPEMQRLGCKCSTPGYCFTVEHDKEYKQSDIDIEYCEQVEEMGTDSSLIKFKKLDAVPTAICMKCFGPYDRLYKYFIELTDYIENENYKMIGQPRFSYIDGCWNQNDQEKWLTIIEVPVEKV